MDNHKYIFLGMLITFLIVVILGVININVNLNNKIYVKEVPKFYKKITSIEDRIEKIEDESCRTSLKELSTRIKDTYYENNISIKDYYKNYSKDGKTYYSMFISSLEVCDINIDDIDEVNDYLLASRVYPDLISDRYKASYEINFTDYFNYKNIHELSDNIGTYSNKEMEILSLSKLVEEVQNEESV